MRAKGFDKILLVSLGLGFFVVCFVVMILTFSDLYMEVRLDKEIDKIQETLNKEKLDEKELNTLLQRETVSGSYKKIEKAYKNNVTSIMKLMDNIKLFNNSVDLKNAFEKDNMEKDGPDFKETKEKIKNNLEEYEKQMKKLKKIKEDESLWSYLPEKKSSKFDKKYLKDNILKVFRMKYLKNILDDFATKKDMLDHADTMISFLEENKEDWKLEEDKITFKTESLETEYQKLYKKWENILSGKRPIIRIGEKYEDSSNNR